MAEGNGGGVKITGQMLLMAVTGLVMMWVGWMTAIVLNHMCGIPK